MPGWRKPARGFIAHPSAVLGRGTPPYRRRVVVAPVAAVSPSSQRLGVPGCSSRPPPSTPSDSGGGGCGGGGMAAATAMSLPSASATLPIPRRRRRAGEWEWGAEAIPMRQPALRVMEGEGGPRTPTHRRAGGCGVRWPPRVTTRCCGGRSCAARRRHMRGGRSRWRGERRGGWAAGA